MFHNRATCNVSVGSTSQLFVPIGTLIQICFNCSNVFYLQNPLHPEQVKKLICFKNWFDLSLFQAINCSKGQ